MSVYAHEGERLPVRLEPLDGGRYRVAVGDRVHEVDARPLPGGGVAFTFAGRALTAHCARSGDRLQVRLGGRTWLLRPELGRRAGAVVTGDGSIVAPMTGTVLQVLVEAGERVEAGAVLVVLNAMKMEHRLAAEHRGTVLEVPVTAGQNVEQGAVLVRVEPADAGGR